MAFLSGWELSTDGRFVTIIYIYIYRFIAVSAGNIERVAFLSGWELSTDGRLVTIIYIYLVSIYIDLLLYPAGNIERVAFLSQWELSN